MTAFIGYNALIISLFICTLLSLRLIGLHPNYAHFSRLVPAMRGTFFAWFFLSISYIALTYGFATSDFSMRLVYEHSHSLKPMLYKFTGVWGNHEGSMLLYCWLLASFSLLFAWFSRYRDAAWILSLQAFILLCFLSYLAFASSPFDTLEPAAEEGQGLNPLLQDIGLAIHPPTLYLGYTASSIAFSFAMFALFTGSAGRNWASHLRPWVLASFSFLTIGIMLGSWWAYRELGWGGYWFWDPVENSSLLPWLVVASLLHALAVLYKRELFGKWCVFLSLLAFTLSIVGFFLVRSGILNSVHSFASDPYRGVFMLVILAILGGMGFTLFALRAHRITSQTGYGLLSRESFILYNNLLLLTLCFIVLLGTVYPIILPLLTNKVVAVGAPYYNGIFNPIAAGLVLVAGVGMILSWKKGRFKQHRHLLSPASIAVVITLAVCYTIKLSWLPILGFSAAIWLMVISITQFTHRLTGTGRITRSLTAMTLAHFGLGLLTFAIAQNAVFTVKIEEWMQPGDQVSLPRDYSIDFNTITFKPVANYLSRTSTLTLSREGTVLTELTPETRLYPARQTETVEAALYSTLWHDIYAVVGDVDEQKGAAVKLYYNPGINLIWIASMLIALGSLLAIAGRKST